MHVVAPATPQHWDPLTDALWDFRGNQLVLTRPDTNPDDGVHRPTLGRRLDTGGSWTYAGEKDWQDLLSQGEWVHLAATFDFANGSMALYRNGEKVDGTGTSPTNPVGHQDRRLLPAERHGAQPVQLPDGHPDVPRRLPERGGGGPAVPPLRAVTTRPRA